MISIATHIPWPPATDEERSIIDDPIYEVVDMMNRAGFRTIWSCCGFGNDADGKPHKTLGDFTFVQFEAKTELVDRLLGEYRNMSKDERELYEYVRTELFYLGDNEWCLRLSPDTLRIFVENHKDCGSPNPDVVIKRRWIEMWDGTLNRLLITLEKETGAG